jgi:hypothetical protein
MDTGYSSSIVDLVCAYPFLLAVEPELEKPPLAAVRPDFEVQVAFVEHAYRLVTGALRIAVSVRDIGSNFWRGQ